MTQLPEKPPTDWNRHLKTGQAKYIEDLQFVNDVTEFNRRYLFWDELKYRVPDPEMRKMVWAVMKMYRYYAAGVCSLHSHQSYLLDNSGDCQEPAYDRHYLTGTIRIHNKTIRLEQSYIINSFMEEAIASSILEGAATTRKVAKEMLRKGRKPKNSSEQMVVNNYEAMNYILEHRDDPLTPDLILEIHRLVTKGTIDSDAVGQFRTNNDIVVANPVTGVVFHTPPDYQETEYYIAELCRFANRTEQDSGTGNCRLHPPGHQRDHPPLPDRVRPPVQ